MSLEDLNRELLAVGIEEIKDIDLCPERTKYVQHLSEAAVLVRISSGKNRPTDYGTGIRTAEKTYH